MSARSTAFELIKRVCSKGTYSNIALDSALKSAELSDSDKRFVSRLFYGVIERRLTLEHIIASLTGKPVTKLDTETSVVLMMGLYQLKYMDSIPDSAAVNESVKLIKKAGKASASGLVNAVLRRFIREDKEIPAVKGGKIKQLSVEYSCPEELIKRVADGYGEENCISLLEASLKPSDTVIRVNTTLISAEKLAESFEKNGISAEISAYDKNCIIPDGLRNVENDERFKAGFFHVQDYSSQLCCKAVAPKAGETVIDVCAAPGGKTFTMAELADGKAEIYACELHPKRTKLIEDGAERLKLECIRTSSGDAREYNEKLPMADAVLCDVPCSGYGVIGGKPEIRYKPLDEADRLPEIQLAILENACRYVKAGGRLVYSTCTVNIKENEDVVKAFLNKHPEFEGESFPEGMGRLFEWKYMTAVFPKDFNSDGFFICRLKRK